MAMIKKLYIKFNFSFFLIINGIIALIKLEIKANPNKLDKYIPKDLATVKCGKQQVKMIKIK